ncbi:MAG: tetratricopeptide repeat protein, partial [Thermomicrobiales bacterium]
GGGSRDAPERHQTLRNTLAWSMHLLSDRERLLFRQLSIFSGGATLDALLRTTIGEPWQDSEVLEALSNLLDNSLIRQSVDSDGATRYSMLETIRAFGREQASETGEYTEFRNAHLRWIVDLAEAAEVELVGPQEPSWRNLLIAEQANIRAALAWAIEKEDVESGLRIAGALWRFWSKRGALLEGREWLSRVLALPGETEPTLLAKSSQALANMCFDLGDYAEAKTRFETSLAIRRTLPEKALIANALNGLGLVAFAQGDLTQAQALHRESLELSREAGSLIGIGNSLSNWADVEMALGNLTESRQLQEEGLEVRRVLGDENSIGYSLYNLGVLARQEGRFDDALGLLNESTERFRSAGDLFGQAYALCDLGVVRAALGDSLAGAADELESMRLRGEIGDQRGMIDCIEGAARIVATAGFAADACRLVGAASSRRQHVGVPRTPSEVVELERWTSAELSGEPNADVLLEEGAAMTLSQAVDLAHSLLHELSRQTVDSSSAGSQARQDA